MGGKISDSKILWLETRVEMEPFHHIRTLLIIYTHKFATAISPSRKYMRNKFIPNFAPRFRLFHAPSAMTNSRESSPCEPWPQINYSNKLIWLAKLKQAVATEAKAERESRRFKNLCRNSNLSCFSLLRDVEKCWKPSNYDYPLKTIT